MGAAPPFVGPPVHTPRLGGKLPERVINAAAQPPADFLNSSKPIPVPGAVQSRITAPGGATIASQVPNRQTTLQLLAPFMAPTRGFVVLRPPEPANKTPGRCYGDGLRPAVAGLAH
jgi:hypothetical protein